MDFHGKVVLITGATRGIGKALTDIIICNGGTVVATGIADADLEPLRALYQDKVITYACDVADEQANRAIVADATAKQVALMYL